jgi:cellulose synthase/poly-beta-1,6-N-acetylglucosamine synthase-like glycosyltransferase
MKDLEIPLGKRTPKYRFFEMLPAILSYGSIALLFVLSAVNTTLATVYLLLVIITLIVKSVGIAVHTIQGRNHLEAAQKVNWHLRLADLKNPRASLDKYSQITTKEFQIDKHLANLKKLLGVDERIAPESIYNAVIIATYNESYEVLAPTVRSVLENTFNSKRMILNIAYEERGGPEVEKTVLRLKNEFGNNFRAFNVIKHPKDLPDEVIGKGSNITYAGFFLEKWLKEQKIDSNNVIVTTLDADNRPHKSYFDYVAYEYMVHDNRKQVSFQPVSLFMGNIWDAPAPMRVIATGNSFWNIISSMRPHALRNFASHSQSMKALEEMRFWSKRTIVEDGHQFWRSYLHFDGNYSVVPLFVPIYQDAVLSDTYIKTLKAQFVQLRRWAYGASDVPYLATHIFTRGRRVPLVSSIEKLIRLIDGHVTLATVSLLVAFGGWVPLIVNSEAARSVSAQQLPELVSVIQRFALIGLFITIFLSMKMLPPRPERYKRRRTIGMVLQWLLMPFTAIFYSSVSALYSQGRLFMGNYLDKFDVTYKGTPESIARAKLEARHSRPLKSKV